MEKGRMVKGEGYGWETKEKRSGGREEAQ